MAVSLIRSLILYVVVIFSVRLMGKRQLGQLQPTELVITILVSNIATLPLEDLGIPLLAGIIPILTLVCFDVIMSQLTLKSRRLRQLVSGSPQIIIRDGIINQNQLRELRFSVDDVFEAMRMSGIFDIEEVQFAIVETTGQISFYQKFEYRAVTNEDLKLRGQTDNPPYIIINDGCFQKEAFDAAGLSEAWLERLLKKAGRRISDIFLLTADESGKYKLVERSLKNDKG